MTVSHSHRTPIVTESDAYSEMLHRLSDASVERSFSPYRDIDWDTTEFQVVPNDPRWILPEVDPLGNHPWYLNLPSEKQIAIGMYRQANIAKVGLQFEQLLIAGFMLYMAKLPNGSAEFRYATHEAIEECNHTLMFQEVVNRTGVDVPGFGPLFSRLAPLIPLIPRAFPSFFWMCVLAGEEPIDHIQKAYLRSESHYHPIIKGVMRIHVAEEARHISFAHEFLRQHVPGNSTVRKFFLSLMFPVALRIACDLIVTPPPAFWAQFDIPRSVKKDLFWKLPSSRRTLSGYFGDVRLLAEELDLINPTSARLWRALKIGGRPSRFRGEAERS